MSERGYTVRVETRNLRELAREEIQDAREAGVDPMEIAQTHHALARLIPALLKEMESK